MVRWTVINKTNIQTVRGSREERLLSWIKNALMKLLYQIQLNVSFCSLWTKWCSWMPGEDFTSYQHKGLWGESRLNLTGELKRTLCCKWHDVLQVFRGRLTDTTTCSEGHSINEETNPFWTLPLSLRDARDTAYRVVSRQSSHFFFSIFMWCERAELIRHSSQHLCFHRRAALKGSFRTQHTQEITRCTVTTVAVIQTQQRWVLTSELKHRLQSNSYWSQITMLYMSLRLKDSVCDDVSVLFRDVRWWKLLTSWFFSSRDLTWTETAGHISNLTAGWKCHVSYSWRWGRVFFICDFHLNALRCF